MTSKTDEQSLSNLELLVLAKVACADGANEDELTAAVTDVAPPDGLRTAQEHVAETLAALRRRSLATSPAPTVRNPRPRWQPTDDGKRLVRATLGINAKPRWDNVKERYVPALALGISAGSEQASKLSQAEELTLAVLRQRLKVPEATTMIALCDALIARALGLSSGKVTLLQLRAHVLAREVGLDAKIASTKELGAFAVRVASKSQEPESDGKRPLLQALGRRWVYRITAAPGTAMSSTAAVLPPANAASPQAVLPIPVSTKPMSSPQIARGSSESITPAPAKPNPPNRPRATPLEATSADTLLDLVREAIPKIGSDGRFGPEKVFVSALWRYIEDDGRLPDLSLDGFKGWLVTANRDQLVDLVRADSQGDMDARLLEESEIRDLGATFHFVIDRRVATSRGYHAR